MAEIKNSFLKSKMNKDLDDRLVPNGEYRDAQNISVGKSEADDIGALENVLGNDLVLLTDLGNANLKIIGYFADDNNEILYLFLTDNTNHYIYQYKPNAQPLEYNLLVSGSFLNFNTENLITGINLVEDLLFWTDNLNQPRKINVKTAKENSGYYSQESHISVAKYNPYQPLEVMKKVEVTGATSSGTAITLAQADASITKGMLVVSKLGANGQAGIAADEYIYVTNNSGTTVTVNVAPGTAVLAADTVIFVETTMTGENISPFFNGVQMPRSVGGNPNWPGDPDFLEDKFVRFSYRFQFDDKEYSLMAPFSQPVFIPKQKGYFMGSGGASPATPTDENDAYISTIVEFMENGVQNVELVIPLPDICSNIGVQTTSTYKIKNLDILFKESDSRAVKVVDTIDISAIAGDLDSYTYNYISSKPYKTLPERQTVRVYDRVPVRALSQEVSGNRVMYGNFQSQHTPPSTIDYQVGANEKSAPLTGDPVTPFYNWVEYPNHTLKQNRNYQVGFILADKFGRQSSVILSSNDTYTASGNVNYGGSTIYHPYKESTSDLKKWWGDALKVLINEKIESNPVNAGEPGLYAVPIQTGFNITGTPTITNTTYSFNLAGGASTAGIPVINSYLRGEYTDFVKVTNVTGTAPYVVTTDGRINEFLYSETTNNPDVKFAYTLPNPLGWYSYKIVVKQQEQDYYNVYLPGIVKGYPDQTGVTTKIEFPVTPTGSFISNTVLINDNINKIPRDLNEVGPEQKQFRSSVRLFGRVENTMVTNTASNIQYFPGVLSDTAITIAAATDANMAYEILGDGTNTSIFSGLSARGQASMYQLDSNPLIARLSTSKDIGAISDNTTNSMVPFLAIYETEPVDSALQLFYESSTVGLIADLNADVDTGFDGVAGLEALSYTQDENDATNTAITNVFRPENNLGAAFNNTAIETGYPKLLSVVDGTGAARVSGAGIVDAPAAGDQFKIVTSGNGYKIHTNVDTFVFGSDGSTKEVYTFTMQWKVQATGDISSTTSTGSLTNIVPEFTAGASFPDVSVSVADTVVVTRGGNNGSATNNTSGLKYSIVSGNNNNYFSINSSTGAITKTNTTPAGSYTLGIKLEDAVDGTGTPQTGSLSVTQSQVVNVGATGVNSGVISNCYATRSVNLPGTNQITAPYTGTPVTGVWYLSNSTLTSGDLPIAPTTPNTNESNFLHKLGSALSQGTVVFSCNMFQNFLNNDGGLLGFTASATVWKIWYRDPNGSNTWNQIADVNNDNMGAPGVSAAIQNGSFGNPKYAQAAFAFDQAGEYCIAAIDAETSTANAASDALVCWVNSNDLNYSTCIVENGSNVTDGNSPKRYEFDLGSPSTSFSCTNTGNTAKYAPHPYGQYVDKFYNNTSLTQVFTPTSAEYYSFTTDVATEPFSSIRFTAKYDTAGAKISPNLIGDPCNDQYARACSGSFTTCAHPVMGGVGW